MAEALKNPEEKKFMNATSCAHCRPLQAFWIALCAFFLLATSSATGEPATDQKLIEEQAKAALLSARMAEEEKAGGALQPAPEAAAPIGTPVLETAADIAIPNGVDARAHYQAGLAALGQHRYDDAIQQFQTVRALEPSFQPAEAQLYRALLVKAQYERRKIALEYEARYAEAINEVARRSVPVPSPSPVPRPRFEPAYGQEQMPRAIDQLLNQSISLNITDGELAFVLDLLFRAAGINIIADPAIIEGKRLSVHVQEIPLRELLDYITRILGVSFTTTDHAVWITTPDRPLLAVREFRLSKGLIDVLTAPQTNDGNGNGSNSSTSDLERLLEKLPDLTLGWTPDSQYYLDKKMNVLFVRSTDSNIREIENLLSRIDITPVQVLIETRFVEVRDDDIFDLGVKWNLTADFGVTHKRVPLLDEDGNPVMEGFFFPRPVMTRANKFAVGENTGYTFPGAALPESSTNGLSVILKGVLTDPEFEAVINALQRTGKATILSAPSIIATNNSTAVIEITRNLVYIDDYRVDRADISGVTLGRAITDFDLTGLTPEERERWLELLSDNQRLTSEPVIVPQFATGDDTGFKLRVTPSVGLDNQEITLTLQPEIREEVERLSVRLVFPGVAQETVVERPVVATRTLTTRMTIADGRTVVIGGLVSRGKQKTKSKVPLLGDVPLMGYLFQRNSERDVKTNLIIFVSARILTPGGEEYTPPGYVSTTNAAAGAGQPIRVQASPGTL